MYLANQKIRELKSSLTKYYKNNYEDASGILVLFYVTDLLLQLIAISPSLMLMLSGFPLYLQI